MDENNRKIFEILTGPELIPSQLKQFKESVSESVNLDLGQLLFTAVECEQFEAAKIIIELGYDMNRENETMAYELFLCSQLNGSDFCTEFYLQQGLKVTDELITKIVGYAESNPDDFEIERTIDYVDKLILKYNKISI